MKKNKLFYKEEKNFLTKKELKVINEYILGDNFPWFFQKCATTEKFPFFSHGLYSRYDVFKEEPTENSKITSFFKPIIHRFCKKQNINIKKIARGCLNLSYYRGIYLSGDPHVDHEYDHKVLMIYLNDSSGDTLIYDKINTSNKCVIPLEEIKTPMKIIKKIKPEQGKVVCWDGNYFHAASFCKPSEIRAVLVITFI
jgi:hypothetical protein